MNSQLKEKIKKGNKNSTNLKNKLYMNLLVHSFDGDLKVENVSAEQGGIRDEKGHLRTNVSEIIFCLIFF